MKKNNSAIKWSKVDWLLLVVSAIIYIAAAVGIYLYQTRMQEPFRAAMALISPALCVVPYMAQAVFQRRFGILFFLFCQCFCFIAFSLGVALNLYKSVFLYDKFIHMLSGVLFYIAGMMLYQGITKSAGSLRDAWLLRLTYAFGVSMGVAVFWEVYEFLGFVFTGLDMQYHLETGVFDTMLDLCACLIGTAITALFYWLYGAKNIRTPIIRMIEEALAARE